MAVENQATPSIISFRLRKPPSSSGYPQELTMTRSAMPCPGRLQAHQAGLGVHHPSVPSPRKTHESCICICTSQHTCQPQPRGTLPVHTSCRSDPASAQANIFTLFPSSLVVSLLQVSLCLPPRQSHRSGRALSHGELSCELSPVPSLAKRCSLGRP